MSHADVKYSPPEEKWLVIWHGNYGEQNIVARKRTKIEAIRTAQGKVTQALKRGWSDGTVHVYDKSGELQKIEDVDYAP